MRRPLLVACLLCCAAGPAPAPTLRGIALPGATAEGVFMDYLAFDHARQRVWVPAGNTGSVDVIDAKTSSIARVAGFPTAEVERHGKKRTVGPSAVTLGMGAVYVGNRADSTICVVDPEALSKGACVALDSSPDGVAHVAKTREVWVTTPRA